MSVLKRKTRVGRVTSNMMDETVTVEIEWRRAHSLYKKSMRRRKRFKVHDSENKCKIGDLVRIVESRPISKTKRWRVSEILTSEDIAEILPEEIGVEDSQPSQEESKMTGDDQVLVTEDAVGTKETD